MSLNIDSLIIYAIEKVAKKIKRTRSKSKSKSKGSGGTVEVEIVFNISGHPLSQEAKSIFEKEGAEIVDIFPDVDMGQLPVSLIEEGGRIIEEMVGSLSLFTGKYRVILPGYAPLSAVILGMLHGITGFFPEIVVLVRQGTTFLPVSPISLQNIRDKSRDKIRRILGEP